MDDQFYRFFACYLCFIEDSDRVKAYMVKQYCDSNDVKSAIAKDSYCRRISSCSFRQIAEHYDLEEMVVLLQKMSKERGRTALYITAVYFVFVAYSYLESKCIAVDDFLMLGSGTDYLLIQLLLDLVGILPSTPARRIGFSRLIQVMSLYSPYYQLDVNMFITENALRVVANDLVCGLLNHQNRQDLTETFNLLVVLLSQLRFDDAVTLLKQVEENIQQHAKASVPLFPFLLHILQYTKKDVHRFVSETIMYISFLCIRRAIEPKAPRFALPSDFFQKLDSVEYVNRYVGGLCFIPHALLYHYSFETYLYAEAIHLQTDLLSSIVSDIYRADSALITITDGRTAFDCYDEDYCVAVLYNTANTEFTSFSIVKFIYRQKAWNAQNYIPNGTYKYMFLHASTPLHLEILDTLKQDLLTETRTADLKKSISGPRPLPIRVVLQKATAQYFPGAFVFPALSFGKPQDYYEVFTLLSKSLRHTQIPVKYTAGDKPELCCGNIRFVASERLSGLIQPLYPSQLACLLHIVTDDMLFIVGAPGTGKTHTAAAIIRAFLLMLNGRFVVPDYWKQHQPYVLFKQIFPRISYHCEYIGFLIGEAPAHQIVLSAHSNNATDQMAEALFKQNFPLDAPFVFRAGSQCQSQIMRKYTVDGYIQRVWDDVAKFGFAPPGKAPSIGALYDIMKYRQSMFYDTIEHFKSRTALQSALLQKASVIAITTSGIHACMREIAPGTILIIEEAARVAEYNVASLLQLKPYKIVFIGDIMQLPPVIKDAYLATKAGLVESLFHKAVHLGLGAIVLDYQMRAHSSICDLYRNIYTTELPRNIALPGGLRDATYTSGNFVFAYQHEGSFQAEVNADEALVVAKVYKNLVKAYAADKITVVSLYKRQALHISKLLAIRAFTVDEYQGLENDVIVVSLVITYPSKFAVDINRTLVAFSRARKELHVVGNIAEFDNPIFCCLQKCAYFKEI